MKTAARALIFLLLLFRVPAARASACADDSLRINGLPADCWASGTQVVAFQDTFATLGRSEAGCGGWISRTQQVNCNLHQGTWYAHAACVPTLTGGGTALADASTHDSFTVLGPEGAAAAPFKVRLTLSAVCTGYFQYFCIQHPNTPCSMPSGDVFARLVEGANNGAQYSGTAPSSPLEITVTRAPGEVFDLGIRVAADAPGWSDSSADENSRASASIGAQLSFPDLPAGWSVVSCQGYQAGQIVPTLNTTWGRVKTMYR